MEELSEYDVVRSASLGRILRREENNLIKKCVLAVFLVMLCATCTYAKVNVDNGDLADFKNEFSNCIMQSMNKTGTSDSAVYGYIAAAINSSWDKYSYVPMFVYVDYYGKETYDTLLKGDKRFSTDGIKNIAVQSKARFFKALYTSMRDLDISKVSDPDWIMITIWDKNGNVVYLLEVNISDLDNDKLVETFVDVMGSLDLTSKDFDAAIGKASYQVTIATYVSEYDEIVITTLFTDGNGNVYGEAVITKNVIFQRLG